MPEAAAIANVATDIASPARALRVCSGAAATAEARGTSAATGSVCVLIPEERPSGGVSRGGDSEQPDVRQREGRRAGGVAEDVLEGPEQSPGQRRGPAAGEAFAGIAD